jgi:hypothetical protein
MLRDLSRWNDLVTSPDADLNAGDTLRGKECALIGARQLMLVACGLLLFWLFLVFVPATSLAQNSCRAACWQAYGACYKATNKRIRCQALLKRCLDSCIRRH